MSDSRRPSAAVLAAFGASGPPMLLPGGRGLTWRAGGVVVRPAEALGESEWKSDVLSHLARSDDFAVPRPIRDDRGAWVREGWEALEWIPGVADPSRVDDVVHAGTAFHRAIGGLPQPAFIAESSHAWSRADRIAWEEAESLPDDPLLRSLAREYRRVDEPSQVIHADLIGNVLFSDGRPPAVIDWAPYWRPSGLGAAIVVADAVCWHGHPIERLGDDYGVPHWRQLLLRALVFRMATLHLLGVWNEEHSKRHTPVVRAVIGLRE